MPDITNLNGPILADTVYMDGNLAARDVDVTLPGVTFMTADFRAMGTLTLPILGQIEAMELAITKIGVDLGLSKATSPESKTAEIRWAQDLKGLDGSTKTVGCKAFLRVVPKGLPGIGVTPGSTSENELTYAVSRYQLFVDGKEQWLIDQLNHKLRIDGKDYYEDIESLL